MEEISNLDNSTIILGFLALIFFVGTYMVSKNLSAYNVTKRRIRELQTRRADLKTDFQKSSSGRKKLVPEKKEEDIEFIKKVVKKLNLIQESKSKETSEMLIAAGYRSSNSLTKYVFAQMACAFGFMFTSLIFVEFDLSTPEGMLLLLLPFGAVYAGFWLPRVLVANNKTKRYKAIQKGLPDGLDLIMICTEAGLTLTAALERVSKELGSSYPELAEELALTSVEIGFLPKKQTAIENLGKRVELPEIRTLVSILIQTDKYGTPISQALRVLAKEFRTQRMLRAEEKAARLPAIMTVPMILFILPTMFIIVISPAVIGLG